ncbi:MAG: short chain dehydrogenase [Carboxylicivirga sp.]|jgi:NAD(P)-dependent dehydrogenase (short-subunit alcohol dehydrogenase family)|nr:short chain dehydrogenase [Carboxylicivirga sp.]
MKILVIGGTGIIGKAVVDLLGNEHEVIAVGKSSGDYQVDIEDRASIEQMFKDFKEVDGIISATGMASLSPLDHMSEDDIDLALNNKLKGQVNLLLEGLKHLKDGGFITLTTGAASHTPFPGGAAITMACAGLEGFVKAVEVEKNKDIRINVIRPAMVTESMKLFKLNVPYSVSAFDTARVYKAVTEKTESGQMYDVHQCLHELLPNE